MRILKGLALIIVGILAILLPTFFTTAIAVIVGVLLIIAGISMLSQGGSTTGRVFSIGIGLVALIAGILFLVYPASGALSLTIILSAFFLIEGLGKLVIAFSFKNMPARIGYIFSGALGVILAAVVWAGLPGDSRYVLGLLLGIDFIVFGAVVLAFRPSELSEPK